MRGGGNRKRALSKWHTEHTNAHTHTHTHGRVLTLRTHSHSYEPHTTTSTDTPGSNPTNHTHSKKSYPGLRPWLPFRTRGKRDDLGTCAGARCRLRWLVLSHKFPSYHAVRTPDHLPKRVLNLVCYESPDWGGLPPLPVRSAFRIVWGGPAPPPPGGTD